MSLLCGCHQNPGQTLYDLTSCLLCLHHGPFSLNHGPSRFKPGSWEKSDRPPNVSIINGGGYGLHGGGHPGVSYPYLRAQEQVDLHLLPSSPRSASATSSLPIAYPTTPRPCHPLRPAVRLAHKPTLSRGPPPFDRGLARRLAPRAPHTQDHKPKTRRRDSTPLFNISPLDKISILDLNTVA
jgi:hypothetical protein